MNSRKIFVLFFLIFFLINFSSNEQSFAQKDSVEIYFFSSAICPHCAEEKEFLRELGDKYPEVKVTEYEVFYHPENKNILENFYEQYKVPKKDRGWVPVTFTPGRYFIGFNKEVEEGIENCIRECLGIKDSLPYRIKIPFFGEIDVSKMSLPVLTITLGALDGLNPCAMWILIFLISLLINAGSRKRIWLIGGTFILTSGIVYYLILTAWLNLFLAISYVNLTRILIGVFALGMGLWQIRNFITYNPGVCKVLGWKSRLENGLRARVERVASSPATLAIIGGLIILAIGVNLIEFFCSAGLPAIYTRILTLSNLNKVTYHLYLLLYTLVFVGDDLIVFSLAMIAISKIGFSEKYNYWSTLVGGLLIFILGLFLIFKPGVLMFG